MPYKPLKSCAVSNCPEKVPIGETYCKKHLKEYRKIKNKERPIPTGEIYDRRWRKFRERFLRFNPLCVQCREEGRDTIATVVHHIIPITGKTDVMMYNVGNCQALCARHHNIKHKRFKK